MIRNSISKFTYKAMEKFIAIFDHDLGGGANLYSEDLIKGLRKRGGLILHIKYSFHLKRFRFLYLGSIHHKEFTLESVSIDRMKALLKSLEVDYIFVNELVSWQNPMEFIRMITELNIPYIIFIHDYFYICPSLHLINDEGKFCNIPEDIKKCEKCLVNNRFFDYSIYHGNIPDINSWRKNMRLFLQRASHIVCFSDSSKKYLTKYCSNNGNIVISEHSIRDRKCFSWKQRNYNGKTSLNIGIIGDIGLHKGSQIVKNLIEHPEFKELPVNIVVIGTIRDFPAPYKSDENKITITGRYERNNLFDLLRKYEISTVLIPSICPETFSFTTSEALLLGYPVICFNIGAHAERVKRHNAGIVVKEISANGLLCAFKEILAKPPLVKELSANTRRYVPPSFGEHFEKILSLLDIDTSFKYKMLHDNSPHCTASR